MAEDPPGSKARRVQSWRLTGKGTYEPMHPIPAEDDPEAFVEMVMDPKGRVLAVREWLEGCPEPLRRTPTYNDNGSLKHSDYENPSEGISGRNAYEYDERGFLKARQETGPDGKVRFRIETRCDDKGNFVEETVFQKGKAVERHEYEYGKTPGMVAKDKVFRGKGLTKLAGFFTYEYDSARRLTRRTWHDEGGAARNAFAYVYDEKGREIEKRIENDGTAMMIARRVLDERGRLAQLVYIDDAGAELASETHLPDGRVLTKSSATLGGHIEASGQRASFTETSLHEVVSFRKEDFAAMAKLGYTHYERGDFDLARSVFESLYVLDPTNPYHAAGVAASAMGLKQYHAAISWYDRALLQDPAHIPSLTGKGEAQLLLGQVDQALITLQAAFEAAPSLDDPLIKRVAAIVATMSQDTDKPR